MKCPECGERSRVRDTQHRTDGTIFRARRCAQGHRFGTVEVLNVSQVEEARLLEAERRGRDELAAEIVAAVRAAKRKKPEQLARAS